MAEDKTPKPLEVDEIHEALKLAWIILDKARSPKSITKIPPHEQTLYERLKASKGENQSGPTPISKDLEFHYPLVAFIDEQMGGHPAASGYAFGADWRRDCYEDNLFGRTDSQVEFFKRSLDKVHAALTGRASPLREKELEYYFLCVALGFRGEINQVRDRINPHIESERELRRTWVNMIEPAVSSLREREKPAGRELGEEPRAQYPATRHWDRLDLLPPIALAVAAAVALSISRVLAF